VADLKQENQDKGREITKDKYHNNREEIEKERRKQIDEIQTHINKLCDDIEAQQAELEKEQERNSNPDHLLKRQKEVTMNLKQDHNKIATDISVAKNRLADLDTRQQILHNSIQDILKDKRKIDKRNMELENKITGRNVTDEMQKQKHKDEERKMRIKYEKNVATLKSQGVIMMEKIQSEENRSKDILDKKLQLEQDLLMLKEDLSKATETHANNREELIKLQVKNSQLTS
jgi:chromosome segregation ATPase